MGNAGSNQIKDWNRDPSKPNDGDPPSPSKEGEVFIFDKKNNDENANVDGDDDNNLDEGAPYYTKAAPESEIEYNVTPRPRSNTLTEGSQLSDDLKVLPTVFKWEGGGKQKVIDNGMGSKNNMVTVKMSDFEVFQALAKDSEGISSSAQTEYSQEIPQSKPWEKVSGPPILPPHLLQVILNKDTPLSCEPTLLPEPNHVMLNHLYALSIKDGVMVLSATHRYRKKYVTTLLYKPI